MAANGTRVYSLSLHLLSIWPNSCFKRPCLSHSFLLVVILSFSSAFANGHTASAKSDLQHQLAKQTQWSDGWQGWMERKGTGQLKARCYPEHADALFEFLTDKANWTKRERIGSREACQMWSSHECRRGGGRLIEHRSTGEWGGRRWQHGRIRWKRKETSKNKLKMSLSSSLETARTANVVQTLNRPED